MIQVITRDGILDLPAIAPDDHSTIIGECCHGESLFRDCEACWLEEQVRYWLERSELTHTANGDKLRSLL